MKQGLAMAAAASVLLAGAANAAAAQPTPSPSPAPLTMPAAPPPSPAAASPAPGGTAGAQSLTLIDAENIALAKSPLLAIARAQLTSAGAAKGLAQSGELPNLGVSADSTRTKAGNFSNNQGQGGNPSGQITSNSATVNLRQLIFDGGRVWSQVSSARYGEDAARYSLQRTVQTVFFSIGQDYFAALQARHALIAANESLRLARVQEELVNAQYKAGLAAKADVLTAQFPMAQAQLKVAQTQYGEQLALATLLNAMGLPATQLVQLVDDTSTNGEAPATVDQLLAVASISRPDLLAAQASAKSADLAVRAASLARFPLISATASDGASGTAPNAGGRNGNSYSYGVGLTFPLYDGGVIHSQTVQAQAQASIAAANLKTAELGVSLSVQQAFLNLETARASVIAANAELANARTVLDVTNAQYKSGVTTLPLLLNAQVGLTTAQTDQITALYAFKIAQQSLLLAEGTIGKQ
ncbi:MAG TPA: TolC family protein [Candidatus Eremiobacteraceae bacterium]|nr:TolC family protein [Candidatus Eremiobacteraceae bacterium]